MPTLQPLRLVGLQRAACSGNVELAQILPEAGVDPDAPAAGVDGRTVLQGAAGIGSSVGRQLKSY